MGDGSEVSLSPAAHSRVAYHIFAVNGLKPQLPGNLQGKRQSLCRAFSEGRVGQGFPLHAVNRNKACNVSEERLSVFLCKFIYVPAKHFVHTAAPFNNNIRYGKNITFKPRFFKHVDFLSFCSFSLYIV